VWDLCFLLKWIPACERVKKSELRASGRLRNVIPAKAGIHLSSWNKLLYGYLPSRVRRCGWHFNRFGDFFARSCAGTALIAAVTLKVTAQRGLERGLIRRFPIQPVPAAGFI
jgi:hypothetical protein